MPSTLERNLTLCFAKIRRPSLLQPPPPPPPPQPQQQHHHRRRGRHRRSRSLPKSILIFNSLYNDDDPSLDCHIPTTDSVSSATDHSTNDSNPTVATPDFASVIASQRFFFSSPGRSNSIIESSSPSTSSLASTSSSSVNLPEDATDGFVGGGVAIPTISPDPYVDFRKSMQEMVEARDLIDVRANWDYLHELLTCYLELNPKSTHKFIVGAFADLLVTLMASSTGEGGCRNS